MFHRIKRIARVALTAMVISAAVAVTASAATVKATGNVNIRSRATASSRILTVMKRNTQSEVFSISKNKKWYKVKVNGKTGYVNYKYIKYTENDSGKKATTRTEDTATKKSEPEKVKLGRFKLTFYGGDTMTASGKRPRIRHTIAVDRRVIPLGTKVYIEGWGDYYAEDTGGAIRGNIIDIFVRTEREANRIGIRHANVYIYKK